MKRLALLALFSTAAFAGKHHVLKATPETVQWGWLDPKEPPRLTIDSGDTVSIETLMHAKDQITKGVSMEKMMASFPIGRVGMMAGGQVTDEMIDGLLAAANAPRG